MKQKITVEQLNELSQPARQKLRTWKLKGLAGPIHDGRKTGPHVGKIYSIQLPTEDYLLSIGQMIEYLDETHEAYAPILASHMVNLDFNNLCDDLWQSVKEVLNAK